MRLRGNDNDSGLGIDWDRARATVGGDDRLLSELLAIYIGEAIGLMKQIRRAADETDLGTIRKAAHTLKGASLSTGATSTSDLAEKLEAAGTGMSEQQLANLVVQLDTSVQQVIDHAKNFIERIG